MSTKSWQTPKNLLVVMTVAMTIAFATWMALLNNFVIEKASFTGAEIGMLQSIREIPGFLAFTAVLVSVNCQRAAYSPICHWLLLGVGVAIAGYFPSVVGLYLTTFIMSVGFHYYETVKQSLSLQWLSIDEAPRVFGPADCCWLYGLAGGLCFSVVCPDQFGLSYQTIYLLGGGICLLLTAFAWLGFPRFVKCHAPAQASADAQALLALLCPDLYGRAPDARYLWCLPAFLMVEKFGYSRQRYCCRCI